MSNPTDTPVPGIVHRAVACLVIAGCLWFTGLLACDVFRRFQAESLVALALMPTVLGTAWLQYAGTFRGRRASAGYAFGMSLLSVVLSLLHLLVWLNDSSHFRGTFFAYPLQTKLFFSLWVFLSFAAAISNWLWWIQLKCSQEKQPSAQSRFSLREMMLLTMSLAFVLGVTGRYLRTGTSFLWL